MATLNFGTVTNSQVNVTDVEASTITITYSAVMIDNPLTQNLEYWISAGAEYLSETYIWVGSASVTAINDGDQVRRHLFNLIRSDLPFLYNLPREVITVRSLALIMTFVSPENSMCVFLHGFPIKENMSFLYFKAGFEQITCYILARFPAFFLLFSLNIENFFLKKIAN
jgi:hypothetical protein